MNTSKSQFIRLCFRGYLSLGKALQVPENPPCFLNVNITFKILYIHPIVGFSSLDHSLQFKGHAEWLVLTLFKLIWKSHAWPFLEASYSLGGSWNLQPLQLRNSTAIQRVDLLVVHRDLEWLRLDFQHGGSLVHIEKDLVEPSSEWTYYAQRTTCESPASAFHEHFPNCHNWQLHDHQHASPWHQKSQRTAAQGCTWSISEPYHYPKAVRFKLLRVAATSRVPVEFWWKFLVHLIPGGDG